jgi:hypothetical protein
MIFYTVCSFLHTLRAFVLSLCMYVGFAGFKSVSAVVRLQLGQSPYSG